VALAVAELVHSISNQPAGTEATPTRPNLTVPPTSVSSTPPETAESAATVPDARSRLPRRATVVLGGLAELFGTPRALLLGARLQLLYPLGAFVTPALTIDGALGTKSTQLADVVVKTGAAAAHLYIGTTTGSVRWDAGPGASIGVAYLSGRPQQGAALEGRSLTAPWGGPEIRGRIAYLAGPTRATHGATGFTPFESPTLALEIGAGLIALPVRGMLDGAERVYSIEGMWASVSAQVGLEL
jgi:hypothetical protein